MTRFVLLSFVFLGWAFYEVSGGGDYSPPRPVSLAAVEDIETQQAETEASEAAEVLSEKPAAAPEKIELTAADTRPLVSTPQPIPAENLPPRYDGSLSTIKLEDGPVSIGAAVGIVEFFDGDRDEAREILRVRGNRVNMRSGPNKNTSIVARLSQGQRVELLEDPGRGWLKLKVLDSGEVGWMAEFLLVASN